MNIDEKFNYFYKTTLTGISHHGDVEINDLNKRLDEDFEAFKAKAEADTERQKAIQLEGNERHAKQELSSKRLEQRRTLSRVRGKLTDSLFVEVEEILGQYRKTPEYLDVLSAQIRAALEMAEGGECKIFISPHDAELKEPLQERCGVQLNVSEYSIKGGIQAEIPSKNIFIDNSFSSKIDDIRANYVIGAQA